MKFLVLILSVSLLFSSSLARANDGIDIEFYVFTDPHCRGCEREIEPLTSAYGRDKVTVYDLRQRYHGERFSAIGHIIGVLSIPLVGVLKDGNLTAVVSGYFSEEEWVEIVEAETDGIPIYEQGALSPAKVMGELETRESVTELFLGQGSPDPQTPQSMLFLIPLILVAALADAVNPCMFYVFTILLTIAFFTLGRKAVLKTSLAFIAAVFIVYYLMGLGLIRIVATVPEVRYLIIVWGLCAGLLGVLEFLGKEVKLIPEVFSEKISSYLRRVIDPRTAFTCGALSSTLLLPCTSGPYFIALNLIADKATFLEGLLLLTIYNAVVMTPFLTITLGILTVKLATRSMKRQISQGQKWLSLLAGSIMILLSLYLLLYP